MRIVYLMFIIFFMIVYNHLIIFDHFVEANYYPFKQRLRQYLENSFFCFNIEFVIVTLYIILTFFFVRDKFFVLVLFSKKKINLNIFIIQSNKFLILLCVMLNYFLEVIVGQVLLRIVHLM